MAYDDFDDPSPAPPRTALQWASSQTIGGVTELAVLVPIRQGIVPGERRSYEERLRAAIANLARRHKQGIPVELDRVTKIHFGRMIVIRPEQYLFCSSIPDIDYHSSARPRPIGTFGADQVPLPLDDYVELEDGPTGGGTVKPDPKPEFRSCLLTLVEFDGELKSYMREIAQFIGRDFDTLFENCEYYPGTADFEAFWAWIREFQIATDLFYATYRDLSVVRIKQLEAFKRRFDAFVARVRSPRGERLGSMDEMFDQFLRENQQYASGFPHPGGIYASDREDGGTMK